MFYIGVTNSLERRIYEHKMKLREGFASRYNMDRLVYFEVTDNIESAIAREKQLKGWSRKKKIDLIVTMNPAFEDLAAGWYKD